MVCEYVCVCMCVYVCTRVGVCVREILYNRDHDSRYTRCMVVSSPVRTLHTVITQLNSATNHIQIHNAKVQPSGSVIMYRQGSGRHPTHLVNPKTQRFLVFLSLPHSSLEVCSDQNMLSSVNRSDQEFKMSRPSSTVTVQ